jgi:hypothetical protein
MKNDFTLLIQGRVLQSTYDFYKKNYKDYAMIVSTWEDCNVNFENENFIIKSKYPNELGNANRNLQFYSTTIGLENVKTKYVIKLRGDEEYSNLEYAIQSLLNNDDKILVSPIFFRKWKYIKYHISDHLLLGKTENLLMMYKTVYDRFNMVDDNFFYKKTAPEAVLGKTYIEMRETTDLSDADVNCQYMLKYYDILDLTNYTPYKVVANCMKRIWNSNFIPENESSIGNMKDLIDISIFNKKRVQTPWGDRYI